MKIIGVTVGTTTPKPNFNQTDPKKGDYIKNKPDFDGLKEQIDVINNLVGDTPISEQIVSAITEITIEQINAICGATLYSGDEEVL